MATINITNITTGMTIVIAGITITTQPAATINMLVGDVGDVICVASRSDGVAITGVFVDATTHELKPVPGVTLRTLADKVTIVADVAPTQVPETVTNLAVALS